MADYYLDLPENETGNNYNNSASLNDINYIPDYYDYKESGSDSGQTTQHIPHDASAADGDYYNYEDYYNYSYSSYGPVQAYDYYFGDKFFFQIYQFEIYVLGFIWSALVVITTIANVFVVIYFLSRKNRGKATNLLFVSIAISDTMTGLSLLPNAIYVYAGDHEMLTSTWCTTAMVMRFYVSRVFHTVSVWQTLLLGVQRYMCVCRPFISGRICTIKMTLISIIAMYACASILHVYHLIENKVGHFRCRWKPETPCNQSCVYMWVCIALLHLVPCIAIVLLTVRTLIGLSKAHARVATMTKGRVSSRSSRDRVITITATLIAIVFMISELPHGLYKVAFVITLHINKPIKPVHSHVFLCIYEIALVVTFHSNFWIYCSMIREFRHSVCKFISCGVFKLYLKRVPSLSSRSGSDKQTVSRAGSVTSRNRVLSTTTSVQSNNSENAHAGIPLTTIKSEAERLDNTIDGSTLL